MSYKLCIAILIGSAFSRTTVFSQSIVGGLCGEYQNYLGTPDYQPSEIVLEKLDPEVNFSRGNGGPGTPVNINQFYVRWTGELIPSVSGAYDFRTYTDDGIRVYIDGNLIINNRTDHGPTYNFSATQNLLAGTSYDVEIEFYENGGGALMQFARDTPTSVGHEIVPSVNLYALDDDNDGVANCDDCDPNDPSAYPGNTEICDGKDNNCDGVIDEGCDRYCDDDDNDGHITSTLYAMGVTGGYEKLCTAVSNINNGGCVGGVVGVGFTAPICGQECAPSDGRAINTADGDANTYPGAPELCDIDLPGQSGYMFDHARDQDCSSGSYNTLDDSDPDADGVPACADNCPAVSNSDQLDTNGYQDGITEGDACEIFCGNGSIENNEECDDGNMSDGDYCSSSCEIEYCRDDAPITDTSKNFTITSLSPANISGSSTQLNSKVALCMEDTLGSRDIYYTTTDANGDFTYIPNLTLYTPAWVNIGIMLHDENNLDIDHHALIIKN